MPMTESKKAQFGDTADLAKSSTSRISFNHSFGPLDSDVKSEPKIQAEYSWSAEVPSFQFKQEHTAHFHSEHRLDHLPLPMQHHIPVDSLEHSLAHNPGTSSKESDTPTQAGLNNRRNQGTKNVCEVGNTAALFSVQPESHLTDCHAIDPIQCSIWNSKNHCLQQNLFDDLQSSQRNLLAGTGSALRLWDDEFNDYSSQGDFYPPNAFLGNIEPFSFSNHELIADVPPNLYEALKFDSEYPIDPVEYPIDQGLYIA
ncbi:hypothetical protein Salat_1973900 [Sesamum alatum]|uniref:Uncharacterized protein n=1 Tax=Sesamum alatum TaxID=300844 RepID=A0AAE1Y541_9LAMI|nr:hypothetical protein Salat_1973900 [Sesamum alatum]